VVAARQLAVHQPNTMAGQNKFILYSSRPLADFGRQSNLNYFLTGDHDEYGFG
jgi:hypothetical protein